MKSSGDKFDKFSVAIETRYGAFSNKIFAWFSSRKTVRLSNRQLERISMPIFFNNCFASVLVS